MSCLGFPGSTPRQGAGGRGAGTTPQTLSGGLTQSRGSGGGGGLRENRGRAQCSSVCEAPDAGLTSHCGEPHPKTRGRLWSMPPGSRAAEGAGRGWAPVRGHLPRPTHHLQEPSSRERPALHALPCPWMKAPFIFLSGGPGWRGALGAWHQAGGLQLVTPLSPQRPLRWDSHAHLTDGEAESPAKALLKAAPGECAGSASGSLWALQSPPGQGRGRGRGRTRGQGRAQQPPASVCPRDTQFPALGCQAGRRAVGRRPGPGVVQGDPPGPSGRPRCQAGSDAALGRAGGGRPAGRGQRAGRGPASRAPGRGTGWGHSGRDGPGVLTPRPGLLSQGIECWPLRQEGGRQPGPRGREGHVPGVAREGEGREGAGGISGLALGSQGLWVVGPTLPALQPGPGHLDPK